MDNNKPYVDPETGATYKDYLQALPDPDAIYHGRPIITGTMSTFEEQGDFKEIFYNPEGYNIIPLPEGDFVDPTVPQTPWYSHEELKQHQALGEAAKREALKGLHKDWKKYPMTPKECYPGTSNKTVLLALKKEDMGTPEKAKGIWEQMHETNPMQDPSKVEALMDSLYKHFNKEDKS